ncbi:hypothetical protein AB3S75_000879 [Citrus x aurantiifolia]
MSGTTPEKDPSPEQKKPDETQTETTRIQATHTPKSKDESPDQNQQSQCQLRPPQQSESKRKGKRTHTSQSSEEPGITSPDAVVYEPNQSDEELRECQMRVIEVEKIVEKGGSIPIYAIKPFEQKSEMMEEKFTSSPEYPQSQNQQNNIQTGRANANGPSQPGGSNPVQGNPPSRLGRRVNRLLCLRN